MNRILVLGGYGGFGARLTRWLVARGHFVFVAGRSLAKAQAFCAELDHAEPVVADRTCDIRPVLARLSPALVIDAAGPFQNSDYRVPQACVEASIPYVDLADGRGFVTGITELNSRAAAAGTAVIAGASSVPALSGAVVRHLAPGLDRVTTIDIAITASKRATLGRSVVAAMLSYAGRPIRLWRGHRWERVFGWQDLQCGAFTLSNGDGLRRRWLALADVPDLDLLPASMPERPAVTFRAGNESALQTLALWLLSWTVRWLNVPIARLTPVLCFLQRLLQTGSDDRSAMRVTLIAESAGRFLERRWVLVARDGDGIEIPTLAAVLVAEEILAGRIAPGARPAGELLTLAMFEQLLSELSVRHETQERSLPLPLYARVLGSRFGSLPEVVRQMHWLCGDAGAKGEAEVWRGTNLLARIVGSVMGFPRAGKHVLHVSFSERDGIERWTRHFGNQSFTSHLSERRGELVERFGPLRFGFELVADDKGVVMRIRRWSAFGCPLPRWLAPRSEAREWEENGRFHFDVPISLPMIGKVVHYTGWLRPAGGEMPGAGLGSSSR